MGGRRRHVEDSMVCQQCSAPMRLINGIAARLQLFWCPGCQRFAEIPRTYRGRQPGPANKL